MLQWFARKQRHNIEPLGSIWAAQCAQLHSEAFAYPWSANEFETLLTAGNVLSDGAVTAESAPRLLALVLSRCAADEAEILTIVSARSCQRRGLGRELLQQHVEALAHRGIARIFLEVGEENHAALGLYRKLGFQKVGERPGYYRSETGPVNALVLGRDL